MRTSSLLDAVPESVPRASMGEQTARRSQVPRTEAPSASPRTRMARRVTAIAARSRLERELRAIVLDLLGPADPAWLPEATRTWVDSTTGDAVEAVCDESLATLVKHLDAVMATAPRDVRMRLDAAAEQVTAGLE